MGQIIESSSLDEFKSRFKNASLKENPTQQDIEKASFDLSKQIYCAFEPFETDLNRIKKMARKLAF